MALERASGAIRARAGGEASVALRVVYAGTLAYAALFVFAAVVHYLVFRTPHGDLGSMVQAIWNTLHGHVLGETGPNGRQLSRLGGHVDPFLLVFVPLFWISSSPLLLPVVQALAVSSGALPVFWLARKHLASSRAGAHFALAYLLYPATQFQVFTSTDSFHAVSLAVPLVLYALWFLDEDRLLVFSAVALLAATTKEEIPLAVGCLGIWYAVRRGRRLFGFGVFAAGLALTLFDFLWVIPHFSPTGIDLFAGRYAAVGGTPTGILHTFFTDPMAFVHAVVHGDRAFYLGFLLVPFLGLSLAEPLLLLGAVPDLAINLISSNPGQVHIGYETTAGVVPFVVVAAVLGAARFKRQGVRLSLWVLVGAVLEATLFGFVSPISLLGRDVRALGSPLVAAKAQAVSLIPDGVPVSASNQLGGHLSERRYIVTFPYVGRARWIVVDTNDPSYSDAASVRFERSVGRYESGQAWRIVFSSQGVVVLRRRSPTGTSSHG